ncbi:hypothetical protein CK203_062203 [Vitis vinifera]|uniref:Uncharacterized protein n=1 Tax=Vitis vinifera TaxID=29760 RepID=A0A438G7H1_VITVI|nr:hypothetical protein CK203_062203 [Vitis vinifera]
MRVPAPAVPSSEPIPEVAPSAPHDTPRTPHVIPPISEPSPSLSLGQSISISEYRGLCHTLQALTTSQSILTQQMTTLRAHQKAHRAIKAPPFIEQTMPSEEPTTGETEALAPSILASIVEPSFHIILLPLSDHLHSFLYVFPY